MALEKARGLQKKHEECCFMRVSQNPAKPRQQTIIFWNSSLTVYGNRNVRVLRTLAVQSVKCLAHATIQVINIQRQLWRDVGTGDSPLLMKFTIQTCLVLFVATKVGICTMKLLCFYRSQEPYPLPRLHILCLTSTLPSIIECPCGVFIVSAHKNVFLI